MAEATHLARRVPLALACVQKVVAQPCVGESVRVQVAGVAGHPDGELGEVVLGGKSEENAQEVSDIYVRERMRWHRRSGCSSAGAPERGEATPPRWWETVGWERGERGIWVVWRG